MEQIADFEYVVRRSARLRAALTLVILVLCVPALTACPTDKQDATAPAAEPAPSTAAQQRPETEVVNPVVDTTAMSMEQFVSAVLGDVDRVWGELFGGGGRNYSNSKLRLYEGQIDGVCEFTQTASAPFYCPQDDTLYLDTLYLADLRGRSGAPGDLAAAYVIAHHVGHHVQDILGYTAEVDSMKAGLDAEKAADLTLRFELQADFFAGVWAHHARLLPGEVTTESADAVLAAVTALGAALPQLEEGGTGFAPDALTHGTAEQRRHWFLRGFETGDIAYGTTFKDQI